MDYLSLIVIIGTMQNWECEDHHMVNIISVYIEASQFLCTLSFVTFVLIAICVNTGKTMKTLSISENIRSETSLCCHFVGNASLKNLKNQAPYTVLK